MLYLDILCIAFSIYQIWKKTTQILFCYLKTKIIWQNNVIIVVREFDLQRNCNNP